MKGRIMLSGAILSLVLLFLLLGSGASAKDLDSPSVEDQAGVDWFCPSLALDSTGTPHVSYWGKNVGSDLRYASWDADEWEWGSVIADSAPKVGQYTSLAIDSLDRPRISYYGAEYGDLRYAVWNGTQWLVETVDSAGNVGGQYTSLQLDTSDNSHVSYYDATNGDLKYAFWDASQGGWSIQVVDTGGVGGNVGTYSSLQLDSTGEPHISYYDEVGRNLKYASGRWDGLAWTWTIEVVDNYGFVGRYTSLALDAGDQPHISYYYQPPTQLQVIEGDLKYASWDPGSASWHIETVDTGEPGIDVGRFTSLAMDAAGHPHISYHDSTHGRLLYAAWDGSQWAAQTVDDTVLVLGSTSLRMDADDQPHIAYGEKTNSTLRYAFWDPASQQWVIQTAYSEGEAGVGYYNSLRLDSALGAHIAYYDKGNRDLRYAYRYWDGSAWTWGVDVVDSEGRTGRYCSLALDQNDLPRIGYLDSLNVELTYAAWDGTQWVFTSVPNAEGMGRYGSMALDANYYPHFSSYGQEIRGLAYARWDGSLWHSETVDTAGNSGWSTSIAVNSAGRPHISYTDADSHSLRYARWTGSTWILQTVASVGLMPGAYRNETSIALDAAGRPHISYNNADNGSLAYASWTGSAWITETVDLGKNLGSRSSLRFDGQSRPHIGYYDEANGDLKYASWDGTAWIIQTVDTQGDAGWYLSLALDPAAPYNPHLSYMDRDGGSLKYAYWDGQSWVIEVADAGGFAPVRIQDLTSDEPVRLGETMHFTPAVTGGEPITYTWDFGGAGTRGGTDTNPTFLYAAAGTYSVTLTVRNAHPSTDSRTIAVRVAADVGSFASLAVDSEDLPHISYYDLSDSWLKYAHWTGLAWSVQVVDATTSCGQGSAIAVDASNLPHISYLAPSDHNLKYAYWSGTAWVTTVVDSAAPSPQSTSIAVDSAGRPRICYLAFQTKYLKCATWTGSQWSFATVDGSIPSGGSVSLQIDAADNPRISYYDAANRDLRYASWDGANWTIQTVDSTGDVGATATSLALNASSLPRISYYDRTNRDLKYAAWDGTQWVLQSVDTSGNLGLYSSLALDQAGQPAIGYYDGSRRDLKYAAWNGAIWVLQTLDRAGDVGRYALMAIDSGGDAHIGYYDSSNGALKYTAWNGSAWVLQVVDGAGQ